MDNRIANDMISSGMIPSGEKKKEDLGRTQYGSAPSPSKLMDAYKSMYDKKEEVINEHHKKDADGNTIPHEHEEELNEGKIPAGLQAYLDKKKGKKEDKKEMKEGMCLYANIHAKRKRGGKMRKKGDKGAPSSQDFANAAKTAKEEVDLFDTVLDIFVAEGYEKKDAYKVMSQLTEEQLNEFAISGTIATLGAGVLKGMLGAGKVAAAAGKGLASAGKAAAVKGMTAAKTAAKGIASTAKTGMTKASDALGKVSNIAKEKTKGMGDTMKDIGKGVGDDVKNEIKRKMVQDDGGSNKITKTGQLSTGSKIAASADLFDIVKGQLLDEGLSEEEIRDIMLTLTPDEILNEISVGKMANYISAADKDVQKTAASIKKDGSVMSDDPRVKKMTNRAQGMAVAGTKIAKKMSPPRMEEYKGSGTPEQQAAMKAQVEVSKKVNRYGGKTPSGTTAVDAKKGIEDVRKSM